MFYQFDDEMVSVDYDSIKDNTLSFGFVTISELEKIYKHFDLPCQAVEICRNNLISFNNTAKEFDSCWLIKLEHNATIGIFILKNAVILVSINDNCNIIRDMFRDIISTAKTENVDKERLIILLLDILVGADADSLSEIKGSISLLEESVVTDCAEEQFNIKLLDIKKRIFSIRSFYDRLIDILEQLDENENNILDDNISFQPFKDKISRLKEDADILTNGVVHLWDAYQVSMEMKLNNTMKVFTLVTTIFFPLTVIVGWYGMNFQHMPEFSWKYGYLYVIILSLAVIGGLVCWFKKKKWL